MSHSTKNIMATLSAIPAIKNSCPLSESIVPMTTNTSVVSTVSMANSTKKPAFAQIITDCLIRKGDPNLTPLS